MNYGLKQVGNLLLITDKYNKCPVLNLQFYRTKVGYIVKFTEYICFPLEFGIVRVYLNIVPVVLTLYIPPQFNRRRPLLNHPKINKIS